MKLRLILDYSLQSGYSQFEFAHKSLQEFLTAEFLVKLPKIPEDCRILSRIPNELAIAVSISSSPTEYFVELVLERFRINAPALDFIRSFLSRVFIEKPDFAHSNWAALAWLILYGDFLKLSLVGKEAIGPFYLDPVFKDLERQVEGMSDGSANAILRRYKAEYFCAMPDKNHIYKLSREGSLTADHLRGLSNYLPKILLVRKSLLSKFKLLPKSAIDRY